MERSVDLLKSLGNERERWEESSDMFKNQMSTIIGDVLLSTAFMAYAGYYDQHMRQSLFNSWSTHLNQARIQFKSDLARIEVIISIKCISLILKSLLVAQSSKEIKVIVHLYQFAN